MVGQLFHATFPWPGGALSGNDHVDIDAWRGLVGKRKKKKTEQDKENWSHFNQILVGVVKWKGDVM